MTAYYNEWEPYPAQWLRNLIAEGLIAKGDVDERSIRDIKASELKGYTQCHFFAGIGGWSIALRLAGWSDDKEVWTGSCPCQPFSVAPANLSALPEKVKRKVTKGTCGPIGSNLSKSAALQLSLENKLAERLPTGGLTMFIKGWKQKVTPSGRQYCQLAVSVRPTSATDCGLLPKVPAQMQRGSIRMGGGSGGTKKWKKIGLLPTVTKRDGRMDKFSPAYERRKSPSIDALSSKNGRAGMVDLAALAGWMMGYPRAWLNQLWEASAMPSSRKSRQSS